MEFIIHNNKRVLNRTRGAITPGPGKFCVEAVTPWDGKIGELVDPEAGVIPDPVRPDNFHKFNKQTRKWTITQKEQEKKTKYEARKRRNKEFDDDKKESGIQNRSLAQVKKWITDQLLPAKTAAANVEDVNTKTALNEILKAIGTIERKQAPFFLE